MKQAIHIFKKDVRYLRYDIAITLLAAIVFVFSGIHHSSVAGSFLPVTWWFLIARVVHAEPLPGFRQFWLTRPYDWKSLLTAKLLFIFVFVNIPLFAADAIIIHAAGFSIVQQLSGLLWTQLLLVAAFVVPACALAAITGGLGELLAATLLLMIAVLARVLTSSWVHWGAPWFELEWVKIYYFFVQLAFGSTVIVVWQYARRRTKAMRFLAGATAAALLLSGPLLPWTSAFTLQSKLSKSTIDAAPVHIGLDTDRQWLGHVYSTYGGEVTAELPLSVKGVPAGMEWRPNGLSATISAPHAKVWHLRESPPNGFDFEANILSLRMTMKRDFYEAIKDQPVQIRGRLFFTLYRKMAVGPAIPLNGHPVLVNQVAVCSAAPRFLRCDSAFRAPSDLVALRILQETPGGRAGATERPFPSMSYSPFPAEPSIDPLQRSFAGPRVNTMHELAAETSEPIAHLERDFEINQIVLEGFAKHRPAELF